MGVPDAGWCCSRWWSWWDHDGQDKTVDVMLADNGKLAPYKKQQSHRR